MSVRAKLQNILYLFLCRFLHASNRFQSSKTSLGGPPSTKARKSSSFEVFSFLLFQHSSFPQSPFSSVHSNRENNVTLTVQTASQTMTEHCTVDSTKQSIPTNAAFPIPDSLAPPSDRSPISILDFANKSRFPKLAPVDHSPNLPSLAPTPDTENHTPSAQPKLRCVKVAALQSNAIGPAAEPCPSPRSPPTISQISQSLAEKPPVARNDNAVNSHCDVFVEVAVYDSEAPTKSIELRFPAHAPLIDLIDSIPCTGRVAQQSTTTKTLTTSLLYIEGTIYADHRFGTTDYETPIATFLMDRKVSAETVVLDNKAVKFLDLTVTLGMPYVFLHQGDCEHLFIVRDVHKTYLYDDNVHKQVLWKRPARIIPCDVCRVRMAEHFTIGDRIADSSPFHYCRTCYEDAHYDKDGKLRENEDEFLVYCHPKPF